MQGILRRVYEGLPQALRRMVCRLPYAWLAGQGYRRTLRLCRRLDLMSRSDVIAFQKRQLAALLEFAVREVPFYESLRNVVMRLDPFDALREFPLLSKEDVQRDFERMIPRSIRRIAHRERTTGGSSGNQLRFLEDDSTYAREMGFMHSQWARVGYTTRSKKATFRGAEFRRYGDSVLWQENPLHNELQFSPFHMNEGTLGLYVKKVAEYRPEFLHGYPSAIDVLAEYVIRHGLEARVQPIKAVLLGSEGCMSEQRDRIEGAFAARVYTFYGQSERVVLGGECEWSQAYHAFPAYGVLEIVREDGSRCCEGEQGEIVGSGFLNRSMPLIRYRTDDQAVREPFLCKCGRCWDRFSNVQGRRAVEGFVVGRSGSKITATALNMHGDVFRNVVRYQYRQSIPGQLVIRVIPSAAYSSTDEERIIAAHGRKLWGEMDVLVEIVRDIPLTSSGKQRRIVSEIVTGDVLESGDR